MQKISASQDQKIDNLFKQSNMSNETVTRVLSPSLPCLQMPNFIHSIETIFNV